MQYYLKYWRFKFKNGVFIFEKVQTSKMLIPSFEMWVGQRIFVYQFRFILFLDGPNSQETYTI